ncbi:hypothetical protein T190820D02B_10359 [Tenacibaculum sp. 190524A05c]
MEFIISGLFLLISLYAIRWFVNKFIHGDNREFIRYLLIVLALIMTLLLMGFIIETFNIT